MKSPSCKAHKHSSGCDLREVAAAALLYAIIVRGLSLGGEGHEALGLVDDAVSRLGESELADLFGERSALRSVLHEGDGTGRQFFACLASGMRSAAERVESASAFFV